MVTELKNELKELFEYYGVDYEIAEREAPEDLINYLMLKVKLRRPK